MPELPLKLQNAVAEQIEPFERILWQDQPAPKLFYKNNIFPVVFGAVFSVVSVFWSFGVIAAGQPLIAIFGFGFFCLGLRLLFSPLWRVVECNNTLYVITDKRAIIFEGVRKVISYSYPFKNGDDIKMTVGQDGIGDLVFEIRVWQNAQGKRRSKKIGFIAVREVEAVAKMLENHFS